MTKKTRITISLFDEEVIMLQSLRIRLGKKTYSETLGECILSKYLKLREADKNGN